MQKKDVIVSRKVKNGFYRCINYSSSGLSCSVQCDSCRRYEEAEVVAFDRWLQRNAERRREAMDKVSSQSKLF